MVALPAKVVVQSALIAGLLSRWANHQCAVKGRGNQNAFGNGRWAGKDDMFHEAF